MSVTAPAGFVAAGMACGIKPGGVPDLALVATDDGRPVPAAAVFTANRAPAAPVQVSRANLATTGGRAAAVVVSSGNANAATGHPGRQVAKAMCALAADHLGCAHQDVVVASTGLIGIPLPVDPLEAGIPRLVSARAPGPEAAQAAAQAIMTTDTAVKQTLVEGPGFSVGGMAKGAAMLAPDLATMLAVLTTDAAVSPADLHAALVGAVRDSFNSLSVDGCCSTNDTVVILASGRAGPAVTPTMLSETMGAACADLANQMALDAEGATRRVRVRVSGAATTDDACRAARRVAESPLVQCSMYGSDPYWGRVVSELGSAGVAFDQDRVQVAYGGVAVCRNGVACAHDASAVATHLRGSLVELSADLGLGEGVAGILTTDLGPGYIAENMRTS